jgi:transposase
MESCRAYRADPAQGLVDKRAGSNSAKLHKLLVEELTQRLYQYTPRELLGPGVGTADGQFWTVVDLAYAIQKWYGVEYRSHSSYTCLFKRCEFSFQKNEKVFKPRNQPQSLGTTLA